MSWTGIVWLLEAPGRPQRELGRFTYETPPEPGRVLTIRDEEYQVIESPIPGPAYCHVQPVRMKQG